MNRLKPEMQKQVIAALVEGNSIRATYRMTDVTKGTVLKLLAEVGKACAEYQNEVMRDLPCQIIQCNMSHLQGGTKVVSRLNLDSFEPR